MKKAFLAAMVTVALAAAACADSGETARAPAEAPDSAAGQAAEPMAAPGEDAVLEQEGEGLMDRVKVSDGEARVVALTRVSGGRIVRAALGERDGRLAYTYDMVVEARPGMVTKVVVDALTAEVVSVAEEKAAG